MVLFQMVLVKNKSNFKFSLEVRKVWLLLQKIQEYSILYRKEHRRISKCFTINKGSDILQAIEEA